MTGAPTDRDGAVWPATEEKESGRSSSGLERTRVSCSEATRRCRTPREWWLIASEEAERDILKRWAAFHLERVGFLPAWVRAWL
jgi:hypothetical protein